MTGYSSETYAASFGARGQVHRMPASEGWAILRTIPDTSYQDAMGCYPLFSCTNWSRIATDFASFPEHTAAFSLVTDPLGDFTESGLRSAFSDLCRPYKHHYILDLSQNLKKAIASNHLRNARKALKHLDVIRVAEPVSQLEGWISLYDRLIARHNVHGIARFSRSAFQLQLETPGIIAYKATLNNELVGMVLFFKMNDAIYYHLAGYTTAGYDHRASFGIFFQAIQDFQAMGFKWLNMGGGAGLSDQTGAATSENGLVRFKKGWTTETRTAWLCGKILNPSIYNQLTQQKETDTTHFFPAYRDRL